MLIFLLIVGCCSVCETCAPFRGVENNQSVEVLSFILFVLKNFEVCLFVLKTFAGSWLRAAAWQGCLVNYTLLSATLETTENEDD